MVTNQIVPKTQSKPRQSRQRARRLGPPRGDTRIVRSGGAPESAAPRHRRDIQGLRAVAVLLVVFSHAGVPFLKGGYVGVDVFFVLSGFLITQLLLEEAEKPRLQALGDFYARRARRILPAAALTLVVTDVVAYRLLNFVRAKQVMHDSIFASLFTANIHFASQGTNYFAQGQPPSPVQHFWSLAVEEQFYLVWPLILIVVVLGVALRRRVKTAPSRPPGPVTRQGFRRLYVAVAVVGLASLAWSVWDTDNHQAAAYFSTFARAWELALGAALCIASDAVSRIPPAPRALLGWIGLGAIVVAAVGYSGSTPFPGYAALLPTVGAALVIGAGLGTQHSRLAANRSLSLRPMRFVGDRSYALYLWHWPVLIIALQYAGHDLSVPVKLLLVLGAFALSIVSYGLFENPIRRLRWSSPKTALILWPVSILAVIIVAGWGIGQTNLKSAQLADAGAPQYPGYAANFTQGGDATGPTVPRSLLPLAPQAAGQSLPAVVAAATSAQRHAPIPSGLTPPVGNLLGDHYDVPSGCEATGGESASNVCTIGDSMGSKSLLVMGDSHAQMWMPAILPMARRDGWVVRLVTKTSCTPPDWYLPRYRRADCSAWYNWAQRQIATIRPTVTLVAGEFSALGNQTATGVSGVAGLIEKLKQVSKHVIVIGDDAPQRTQPVDCLLSSGASMATCSTEPSAVETQADSALAEAVPRAGARYIDPTRWFCYENVCPMVIGHTVVYSDTTHITATYAAQLAEVFRTSFRKAIGAPA
jgi:peptidoglycan/LPS O-acetylase OafA/YrhL